MKQAAIQRDAAPRLGQSASRSCDYCDFTLRPILCSGWRHQRTGVFRSLRLSMSASALSHLGRCLRLLPSPASGCHIARLAGQSKDGISPHDFVYGEVRKGGTVTYYETTGENNKFLHQIIVLAGHEVDAIGDIYINDEVVTLDGSGFVTS
jgi:hypothetical protein